MKHAQTITLTHFFLFGPIAERTLTEQRKTQGHSLQVLQIVASSDNGNPTIRQAAAVHFKNIVKKGWDSENAVGISNEYYFVIKLELNPHQLEILSGRNGWHCHFPKRPSAD